MELFYFVWGLVTFLWSGVWLLSAFAATATMPWLVLLLGCVVVPLGLMWRGVSGQAELG